VDVSRREIGKDELSAKRLWRWGNGEFERTSDVGGDALAVDDQGRAVGRLVLKGRVAAVVDTVAGFERSGDDAGNG
jgi:hypothetical protein